MSKIDQLKTFFNCDHCNQLLLETITLVCGKIVCKRMHIDELVEKIVSGENTFICPSCQEEHHVPKKGFVVNKRIQSGLGSQFNTLKFYPVFDECKEEKAQAKEIMDKIEILEKDPENYIYEYFDDFKRKVDLRREELKMKIDKYSDEIIQSIEGTQLECKKVSKEVDHLATEIKQSKKELDELIYRFDT